jgi:hypothetical protein
MSQTRLFDVAKVGCFCDAIGHSIEKRRGEEVKILTLTLRVAPFDSKLATAMPDGVKATLFKLNSGDPKETLRRADFALGLERQLLRVYAAPDTHDASIALDQVKVTGTYARSQKDRNGYDFVFKASFGPCDKNELEYVQAWLLTQRFVTFEQAEPGMFDDDASGDEDMTDADEKAQAPAHAPMWDDGDDEKTTRAARAKNDAANRKLHSHASKKKPAQKARPLQRRRR